MINLGANATDNINNDILQSLANDALELAQCPGLRINASDAKKALRTHSEENQYFHIYMLLFSIMFGLQASGLSTKEAEAIRETKAKAAEQLKKLKNSNDVDIIVSHQAMVESLPPLTVSLHKNGDIKTNYLSVYRDETSENIRNRPLYEISGVETLQQLLRSSDVSLENQWLLVNAIIDYLSNNRKSPFYHAIQFLEQIMPSELPWCSQLNNHFHQQFTKSQNSEDRVIIQHITKLLPRLESLLHVSYSGSNSAMFGKSMTMSTNNSMNSNATTLSNISSRNYLLTLSEKTTLIEEDMKYVLRNFDVTCHRLLAKEKNQLTVLMNKVLSAVFSGTGENTSSITLDKFMKYIKPKPEADGIPSYAFALYCVYRVQNQHENWRDSPCEVKFIKDNISNLYDDFTRGFLNTLIVEENGNPINLANYIAPLKDHNSKTSAMNLIYNACDQELRQLENGLGLTEQAIKEQEAWYPKDNNKNLIDNLSKVGNNDDQPKNTLKIPDCSVGRDLAARIVNLSNILTEKNASTNNNSWFRFK